jgi:hypothetical protein
MVLSLGVLMQRIVDGKQLPSTYSEIAEDSLRTVVPSGKLMLVFDGRRLTSKHPQVLALTEDGVWGYVRAGNNPLLADEPVLRGIHDSTRTSVILRREVTMEVPKSHGSPEPGTVPVTFTRGEIYELESPDASSRIRLNDDKKGHIRAQGGAPEDVVELPDNTLRMIDVEGALPPGVKLSAAKPNTLEEYGLIYRHWRKAREVRQLRGTRKDCGVEQSFSVVGEKSAEAKFTFGTALSLDQIKQLLSVNVGLDASYAAKIAQTFKEIRSEQKNVELGLAAWIIEGPGEEPVLSLVERKTWDDGCAVPKDTSFHVNYGTKSRKPILPVSAAATPALHRSYRSTTGQLHFTCYADAVSTVDELIELGLPEQASVFVVAQLGHVRDWTRFMKGGCKPD